jgi:hypothetical protein
MSGKSYRTLKYRTLAFYSLFFFFLSKKVMAKKNFGKKVAKFILKQINTLEESRVFQQLHTRAYQL